VRKTQEQAADSKRKNYSGGRIPRVGVRAFTCRRLSLPIEAVRDDCPFAAVSFAFRQPVSNRGPWSLAIFRNVPGKNLASGLPLTISPASADMPSAVFSQPNFIAASLFSGVIITHPRLLLGLSVGRGGTFPSP
jgi:hypothetical protein